MYITGGGAFKYNDILKVFIQIIWKKELNVDVIKVNEFESLSLGLQLIDKYH
jgi:hypothetical protein